MTRVFIGGSRRIGRPSDALRGRIDRLVEKGIPALIGDANGADKAVQRYLRERAYKCVEVFSSDATPRNNVGDWPVRVVRPAHARRDFDYYATKDRAMAAEATVGLMVWDGESRGTLLNVLRLIGQHKPVVVYVGPRKAFIDVRNERDFDTLVAGLERTAWRQRPVARCQLHREGTLPDEQLPDGFPDMAPDLAVEVLSPDDRPRSILDRVGEYLQTGVRLVWVIDPKGGRAAVYRSLTDVRELKAADSFDGEDVLPGFRCSLAEILK